jgi:hypothetical protein
MRLRLVAIAVVMLFGASPLATTICDAICAQQTRADHERRGHACCHAEQAPVQTLRTPTVTCAAPVADLVSAPRAPHEDGQRALALPPSVVPGGASRTIVVPSRAAHADPHPSNISTSASQLRI